MATLAADGGSTGKFRTPKHIRELMVRLLAPTPNDLICDISLRD
ncbi:N-6 DNA methylase [Paenibacillus taihuensis]|nr:N-6 DNA methylase [Paenibacillus taihuensis]